MRGGAVMLAGGCLLGLGLAAAAGIVGSGNGGQPIQFNHKAHSRAPC
jgi:hypothetical protein